MDGKITYLNTDLELTASEELPPLVNAFEQAGLYALHVIHDESGPWHACFEVDGEFPGPEESEGAIATMLGVIESLPENLLSLWWRCTQREFNIGYDCGAEPWAFYQCLSNELLRRIAALGASLRIRIYPDSEAESQSCHPKESDPPAYPG